MNFDEVIKSHSGWKARIANHLTKADPTIDVVRLESDSRCALGKWIYGEGMVRHGSDATFHDLHLEHAKFHREAAGLVKRVNAGEKIAEASALGANSAYSKQFTKVVGLLMEMKRKAGAAH